MEEIARDLQGPPGSPGVGLPGKQGPQGVQGIPGLTFKIFILTWIYA